MKNLILVCTFLSYLLKITIFIWKIPSKKGSNRATRLKISFLFEDSNPAQERLELLQSLGFLGNTETILFPYRRLWMLVPHWKLRILAPYWKVRILTPNWRLRILVPCRKLQKSWICCHVGNCGSILVIAEFGSITEMASGLKIWFPSSQGMFIFLGSCHIS